MYNCLISVPRSGQHMIESALRYYHQLLNIPFHYCEFYGCCKTIPCNKNINAIQKNHDFELNIELKDNTKYVFLYRSNILQQIDAHYRFHTQNKKIDYTNENIINDFKNFIQINKRYYKNIYNKYLNQNKTNILDVEYDNIVNNFNDIFRKILIFFNIDVNEDFIEQTKINIKPKIEYKIYKTDKYYSYLNTYIKTELAK